MSRSCYGRRLSELLQEQQEPFLLLVHRRGSAATVAGSAGEKGDAGRRRSAVGGTLRRALRRWDITGIAVAGCFPCGAAGGRERFRRLPRADDDNRDDVTEFDDGDVARRLSPVSVLDVLHADEESLVDSNWEEEEDDDKPSMSSASSPPSDLDLTGFTFYTTAAKIRATEAPEDETRRRSGNKSTEEKDEEQRIVSSSWESVAVDIAKIPALVELDLSGGLARERRRRRRLGEEEDEEEAWRVGASIEAMIFEEMRREAVRDMIDNLN